MLKFLFFIVLAYFLGAIPNGVWIGKKVKGIDIREHGSKNTGATNALRVLGPKLGGIVFLGDVLKGLVPVLLANKFGINGTQLLLVGVVAILGHSFSCFIDFKGGKGVATSLGVFLYLVPVVTIIALLSFAIIVYITGYVSLGSIIAAAVLPIMTIFMPLSYGLERIPMVIITSIVGLFVIYKHKSNIVRLLNGTENKFKRR
jgi:glycerol-3-phosphate acyltransferase PlsY